ncbi:MAG: response regulator transcription factor [Chloroflexi bacterium]|nr:response regulator transcription factor [Chloroflexota bacterium]
MIEFLPQSYRILAVDDSEVALHMITTTLSQAGFVVMVTSSGEEALALMETAGLPHLAIVDVNMPGGMDGFEFCDKMQQFCDLPVIMLTAIDDENVIIQAIEEYAEDYITKPVSQGELIARVRRVLRRIGNFALSLDEYTHADNNLSVNFVRCEAVIGCDTVQLTPTETKLLYILMRSAGQLVTTSFLIRRLWPGENKPTYEDKLRVYIYRLRTKIEKNHTKPEYILSRRRKGYLFSCEAINI